MTPDTIPTAIERAHMLAMLDLTVQGLAALMGLALCYLIEAVWRKR
jgi:hypothetical protein